MKKYLHKKLKVRHQKIKYAKLYCTLMIFECFSMVQNKKQNASYFEKYFKLFYFLLYYE